LGMSILRNLLCALGHHDYHFPHKNEPPVASKAWKDWLYWVVRHQRMECKHCLHEHDASRRLSETLRRIEA
jgi:hypothetical protein